MMTTGPKEKEVHQDFERRRREIMDELSQLAKEEGFVLQVSQVGMVVIPATKNGQAMGQEDLAQLSRGRKEVACGRRATNCTGR